MITEGNRRMELSQEPDLPFFGKVLLKNKF